MNTKIFKRLVSFALAAAVTVSVAGIIWPIKSSAAFDPTAHGYGLISESPVSLLPAPSSTESFISTYEPNGFYPPVGEQGTQNSSAAWAVAYAYKTAQEALDKGRYPGFTESWRYSPSYVYNQVNYGVDYGSTISEAMEIIKTQGVCSIYDMPYNENNYTSWPTNEQMNYAFSSRVSSYGAVPMTERAIKSYIQSTGGVVLGVPVGEDFLNINESNPVYDVSLESKNEWQAICLTGWSSEKQAFRFINSWGTDWGLEGYGYISYNLIANDSRIYGYAMIDSVNGSTPSMPKVSGPGVYYVPNDYAHIVAGQRREVRFTAPMTATYTFRSAGSELDAKAFVSSSGNDYYDDDGGDGTNYFFTHSLVEGEVFTFYAGVFSDRNPRINGSYWLRVEYTPISAALNTPVFIPAPKTGNMPITFTAASAGKYMFESSVNGGGDPVAYFYDAATYTQGLIINPIHDDNSAGNNNYRFIKTLAAGETFIFYSFTRGTPSNYTLTVTKQA